MTGKRLTALWLCVCLCLTAAAAAAEPVSVMLMQPSQTGYGAENPKSVLGAANVGDTLYILTDRTLEAWKPGETDATAVIDPLVNSSFVGEDGAAEARKNGTPVVGKVFSDGAVLYGLSPDTGELWKLADAGGLLAAPEKLATLDWATMERTSADGQYQYTPQLGDVALANGVLYMALTDWEHSDNPYELCSWSLEGGAFLQSAAGLALRTLAPYKNGLLLCKQYDDMHAWDEDTQTQIMPKLVTLDPATGAVAEVLTFASANIQGVRYNADTDTIYYIDGATAYAMPDPAQPARITAYLPNRVWDDANACLLPGGMLAVVDNNGVVVRALDAPGIENGALTVYGEYGSLGHQAYIAQYPQALVTCSDAYYENLEAFTNAMVSGSDMVDVLRLDSDYTPLARLIDKGYALDLSAYPDLMALAAEMDPKFTAPVTKDGKLYGLPVDVYATGISYNSTAWESLGLTQDDLPRNALELMDFIANWQADYGEEHAELMLTDNGGVRDALFGWLMSAYVAYQKAQGQDIAFDTELYRSLLKGFEGIDFTDLEVNPEEQDDEYWSRTALFSFYNNLTYPGQYRYSGKYLLLPLADGLAPVAPADVQYLIINPRTAHLEQAVQYLGVYARNLDPESADITLFPAHNEPIVNKSFESDLADWKQAIQDYQTHLETARPEEVADLKSSIEYFQKMIDNADTYRYDVAQAEIEAYRNDVAPCLTVVGQTPLNTWDGEKGNDFYTLQNQYLQGAINADSFVREIDKRLRMMQLEDQ